jgi:endo-1,4-beta-mannosidase
LDLVSYSCYDTCIGPALTGNPTELREAVQYIKQNMPDSAAFGNDNVYLGEFGIPENSYTPAQIETVMTNTVTIGLEENCPYIIYWQLYDNEISNTDAAPPITLNSDMRGFWLIKPDGTKSWHYNYLKKMLNQNL